MSMFLLSSGECRESVRVVHWACIVGQYEPLWSKFRGYNVRQARGPLLHGQTSLGSVKGSILDSPPCHYCIEYIKQVLLDGLSSLLPHSCLKVTYCMRFASSSSSPWRNWGPCIRQPLNKEAHLIHFHSPARHLMHTCRYNLTSHANLVRPIKHPNRSSHHHS